VVGGSVDLLLDRPETLWSAHVLFELALIALSLGAALWLARGWRRSQVAVGRLAVLVQSKQAESDAWQRSAEHALEGLSRAIDGQCELWGLTPTERETALLLLKGHSHKRIARLTGRSERTVRQHAVAVYRKSGLAGRAELAAFFLEGLRVTPSSPGDDA
jgi:DNA-binding NarL/FixJ family response regulator